MRIIIRLCVQKQCLEQKWNEMKWNEVMSSNNIIGTNNNMSNNPNGWIVNSMQCPISNQYQIDVEQTMCMWITSNNENNNSKRNEKKNIWEQSIAIDD